MAQVRRVRMSGVFEDHQADNQKQGLEFEAARERE